MDPRARVIVENCFNTMMSHASWQAFGFKRRPQRGMFVDLIKPAWRKSVETTMIREMLVAFTAAHLRGYAGDTNRAGLAADVFAFYVGDDGRFEPTFGPIAEFQSDVAQYMNATGSECSDLVIAHLGILKLPDRRTARRLMWGACLFPERLSTITLLVSLYGSDMSNWPRPKSDAEWLEDATVSLYGAASDRAARPA